MTSDNIPLRTGQCIIRKGIHAGQSMISMSPTDAAATALQNWRHMHIMLDFAGRQHDHQ